MEHIKKEASKFSRMLSETRGRVSLPIGMSWYPYDSLGNVWHLDQLLTGERRKVFDEISGKWIADIGAADGDMAFFLERLGAHVDIIDQSETNANGLLGARTLKQRLGSAVRIFDANLDNDFLLPRDYDVVLFLGILYHLKNPYRVLEQLSAHTRLMFLSTRICAYTAPTNEPARAFIGGAPVAYLLAARQCNNDPTNYWILSEPGLRQILARTGWKILDYYVFGAVELSDPWTPEGDARAFCFLQSERFQ